MAYSRLVQDLRQSFIETSITEYINKISNQDTDLSYKMISELLQAEAQDAQWAPAHEAWQALQQLTQRLLKRDEAVTPAIYEAAIQKVARVLEALEVQAEKLTSAKLLIYTFIGLNKRNKYLDELTGWSAAVTRMATAAMKKFNNKNRQENLRPIIVAIERLLGKIESFSAQAVQQQPAAESKTELKVEADTEAKAESKGANARNAVEQNLELHLSPAELERIVSDLADRVLKHQDEFKALEGRLTPYQDVNFHTITPDQDRKFRDTLNTIKEITVANMEFVAKVVASIQRFLDIYPAEPEYKRLAELEKEIDRQLEGGKVIPYDEKLAQECHLSQDQKDAWRQHAYINYDSGFSVRKFYNQMREAAGLIHAAPVVGPVTRVFSKQVVRRLPGAQAVMGSQASYVDAMRTLKKELAEARNEKMGYFTKIQKIFKEMQTLGAGMIERADGWLVRIGELAERRAQLKPHSPKSETPRNDPELKQKVAEIQKAMEVYIKDSNKLIVRLIRQIFGVGVVEYQVATRLKQRLEREEAVSDMEQLRTVLNEEKSHIKKKGGHLQTLINTLEGGLSVKRT